MAINLPVGYEDFKGEIQSTATLPRVRIVDAEFENPDGSEVILDTDFLDEALNAQSPAGPITQLKSGKNYIRIW